MDLLANPSLKRAAVGALTAGVIVGNKRLGLGLETADIAALVALAIAFLTQSAIKEVKLAGQEAAERVDSAKAAAEVLSPSSPTTTVNVENK